MTHFWKKMITGLSLALGLAASGGTANAAFTVDYQGIQVGTGAFSITGNSQSFNVNAGAFGWKATQNAGGGLDGTWTNGTNFRTFCIELVNFTGSHYTFTGQALDTLPTSIIPSGMGPDKAGDLTQFVKRWAGTISDLLNPGTLGSATNGTFGAYTNNVVAAAVQLAIWEIVYETKLKANGGPTDFDYNVSTTGTDGFIVNSGNASAIALAQSLLNGTTFTGTANLPGLLSYKVTNSDTEQQDQITLEPGDYDDLEPVPAPPALILALVGVVPCLAMRRRLRGPVAAA